MSHLGISSQAPDFRRKAAQGKTPKQRRIGLSVRLLFCGSAGVNGNIFIKTVEINFNLTSFTVCSM